MSFNLNFIPHSYIQGPQKPKDPVLSEEAMKLANEMELEDLCHFLKIINGFIENGVSDKELSSGVGIEELLDVRNVICKIIIDRASGLTCQERLLIEDFREELEKCFSVRSKRIEAQNIKSKKPYQESVLWKTADILN